MKSRLALAIAPGLIGLSGVIPYLSPVLGGNTSFLTRWGGVEEVTMKPITSFSFIVASLLLTASMEEAGRTTREIGLFLIILIFSGFININQETTETMTVGFNVPSIGTLAVFLALGVAGMLPSVMGKAGRLIFAISATAILGHLMNTPQMFYFWEGWSTAMARPTAVAGFLVGLFILTRDDS